MDSLPRQYTPKEILDLRHCVENSLQYGWFAGAIRSETRFVTLPDPIKVEHQVRTYMVAGFTAEDLIASEHEARTAFQDFDSAGRAAAKKALAERQQQPVAQHTQESRFPNWLDWACKQVLGDRP